MITAMHRSMDDILAGAAELLTAGRKVALCVIVRARGSTPASVGALLCVDDLAGMDGTIGGGCVEAELRRQVIAMLSESRTGVLKFELDHDYGWDDALICGGSIEVAVALPDDAAALHKVAQAYRSREATVLPLVVETDEAGVFHRYDLNLPPQPRLLIAGAGHIGGALSEIAVNLDFQVTVFDDRDDLIKRMVHDGARRVVGAMNETILDEPIDNGTYIVVVTRGHRHDQRVLRAVVEKPAKYIGMIGSRRKIKLTFDNLRAEGVSDAALARVHAPIGLDIGAVTVNEIALAIASQLVEVRRRTVDPRVIGPRTLDEVDR